MGGAMENNIKIQQVSKVMYWACLVYITLGIGMMLALNGWLIVDPQSALASFTWEINEGARVRLLAGQSNLFQRLIAHVFSALPIFLGFYGVWRISRLFRSFRQGAYFTAANAGHLFIFAVMMVLSMVLRPIANMLMEYVLSLGNPDGSVGLSITLNMGVFQTVFVSCTFMAFSWIMLEGKRLAAENEAFV